MSSEFARNAKLEWESEEYQCVNGFLNKLNIPKQDEEGRVYSTVGRIMELMRMNEAQNYPQRMLSKSDLTDQLIFNIKTQ